MPLKRVVLSQNVVQYTGIQDLKISTTHLPADVRKVNQSQSAAMLLVVPQAQNAYQRFVS